MQARYGENLVTVKVPIWQSPKEGWYGDISPPTLELAEASRRDPISGSFSYLPN